MSRAAGAMSVAESIRETLSQVMAADPSVVLLGESVGQLGGVFRTSVGLLETYGPERVIQTPLSESAVVGLAVGMAMAGKRPVVELVSGAAGAYEQLAVELERLQSAEFPMPLVLRIPMGELPGGEMSAHMAGVLTGLPHLQVLCPSTPADAAAMLREALSGTQATVILESVCGYASREQRPQAGPVQSAQILREGSQATLLSYGAGVAQCLDFAESSELDLGVVDLRCLNPLDHQTVAQALRQSGRLVLVHPSDSSADLALADRVSAELTRAAFLYLESPPVAASAQGLSMALSASLRF